MEGGKASQTTNPVGAFTGSVKLKDTLWYVWCCAVLSHEDRTDSFFFLPLQERSCLFLLLVAVTT